MTKTAVVILNYNGKHFLEKFLPAVTRFSPEAFVVVADNCSTDNSLHFLENEHPSVTVIRNRQNGGFAKGYNDALKQIDAEYYMLLNSDVKVTEDWLGPLEQLLDSRADVAACQPKIRSFHEPHMLEYAGAGGGFIDSLAYPFCRGRIFDHLEEDRGQFNDTHPVFWATGAALFVRSEVFHELGGFDEDFFAHMEEIDLCWRIHLLGKKVYYQGSSEVYHVGGGTLHRSNPRKTFLNFRNSLRLLFLNSKSSALCWKLPLRCMLDLLAVLQFLGKGQHRDAKAVLLALGDFSKEWRVNVRKRKKRKANWRYEDPPIYKGSILFDFFVKRKKRFSELNV